MRYKVRQCFVYKMADTKINNKPLKIAVGTNDFKEMATEYDVFVDKTLFIKEIIDSSEKAILITHPRRWGKTLNLDMLKTFFEPESEECKKSLEDKHDSFSKGVNVIEKTFPKLMCNRDMFAGGKFTVALGNKQILAPLQISSALDNRGNKIIDTFQGKYPVIFISLKDVTGRTVKDIESKLRLEISTLFSKYEYLLTPIKEKQEKSSTDIRNLRKFDNLVQETATENELKDSLRFLSELLYKHHGQRAYILVDEYDKPVNSLLEKNIFSEDKKIIKDITEVITSMLSACGKDNNHLEKIILTGIFDTLKKEGNSGFNNVKVYGISEQNFSRNFGFNEQEIAELVNKFNFQDKSKILNNIKEWYNGYSVPVSLKENIEVYTPWAVMSYLNDLNNPNKGEEFKPQNYWTESGYSILLKNLLEKEACINSEISQRFQNITAHNSIKLDFNPHVSLYKYYDLSNMLNLEKVFSYLLLNSGYLTLETKQEGYHFKIPNFEVKQEFVDMIQDQIHNKKCTPYQKLLDNLHKKVHLDVISAIKKQDVNELDKIFDKNPEIKCNDSDLSFNYLHIAALVGNEKIFTVIAKKCHIDLLYEEDAFYHIQPYDYAYLSNNWNMLQEGFYKKSETTLNKPENLAQLFCMIKSAGIKAPVFSLKITDSINAMGFGIEISSLNCDKYNEYNSIKVENPKGFLHLKQFEKYKLEKEQSINIEGQKGNNPIYVTLSEICDQGYKKTAETYAPIFKSQFYTEQSLQFSLCEPKTFLENIADWWVGNDTEIKVDDSVVNTHKIDL